MPRPLRLHVPGACYHVTLRGNHRQRIFFTPGDRRLFERITAEVLERFPARLHAFCLMSNHVHLVIQVGEMPLGRLILRIAGRYARMVQARLGTTGHLFEKRYHAVLVDADAHLLELLRYVHLNPVRAHLVAHPSDYPWSSHHAYLGSGSRPWVTTELASSMLGRERGRAIAAYRRFVEQGLAAPARSPLDGCNPGDRRILGDDDFARRLAAPAWQPRSRLRLADIVDEACRRFGVAAGELVSPSRQRRLTQARAWVAHRALAERVASLAEVARTFGRNEASLRESVARHFGWPGESKPPNPRPGTS